MALATTLVAAAGSSSAFAAMHHSRAASPPIHARKAATALYVSGYAPAQFLHGYALDQLACTGDVAHPCGSGQTVGIIDAYDDPTVEADLQTFDAQFGLHLHDRERVSQRRHAAGPAARRSHVGGGDLAGRSVGPRHRTGRPDS